MGVIYEENYNVNSSSILSIICFSTCIDANEEPVVVPVADEVTHIVTFDPDDGVTTYPEMLTIDVVDGGLITDVPANPTRLGYFFKGWYRALDGNDQPIYWDFATDTVTENTLLWGAWEEGALVTFDPDDGVTTYPDFYKTTVALGDKVTDVPANPTRPGYVFKGWASSYDGNDQPVFWNFATDVVTDNTTLWAEWTEAYIVGFDRNDGRLYSDDEITKVYVGAGERITQLPEAPTRPGYVFAGWTVNSDNEDKANRMYWSFATETANHNLMLYASWDVEEAVVDPETNVPVNTSINDSVPTGDENRMLMPTLILISMASLSVLGLLAKKKISEKR